MIKKYRDTGACGALLDEYEKALDELKGLVSEVTPERLIYIVDRITIDNDCRSIQTILTHVISSGYNYVITIRNHLGESIEFKDNVILDEPEDYNNALSDILNYTIELIDDYPKMNLEESDNIKKLTTRWGQMYNIEQLLEHAIVHVLRHRRQIERFLLQMNNKFQ